MRVQKRIKETKRDYENKLVANIKMNPEVFCKHFNSKIVATRKELHNINMTLWIIFLISTRLVIDITASNIQNLLGVLKKRQTLEQLNSENKKVMNPYHNLEQTQPPFHELLCQQYVPRGHLTSIHGNEQNQFIQNLIKTKDQTQPETWIGFSDCYQEGLFLWSDGSLSDFTQWKEGQPDNMEENENCVHINSEGVGGKWSDKNCTEELPFVCTYKLV
ncbi:C-type lectin mannose-binding isoform-like [Rhincodon typus]|uniref:C-type lectin mannose-binding isoform-like n=1 Tax=Rhincodon typus TaxID=259920 RepID=UPI00202E45E7|nr:C-type lectin mannose-binding isoform-like [Rhincodon typus]